VFLDGQGHAVDGVGDDGTIGVYGNGTARGLSNVTVTDVTVTDWEDGLGYERASDGAIAGVNASGNNNVGILLFDSSNNTLQNNTASGTEDIGINLFDSSNNTLRDNTVSENDITGLYLFSSSNNTLRNNTASGNSRGIELQDSSNNTLRDNTASGNNDGIYLSGFFPGTSNNTLTRTTVTRNVNAGIVLFTNAYDNRIYDNVFNNDVNVEFSNFAGTENVWNTSKQSGTNVIGGPTLGGNYYAKPDGTGFSQTCDDPGGDGICDSANDFGTGSDDNR